MRNLMQLLILLMACAAAPASAELYKWVDERGVTNYSNAPPAAALPNKVTRVDNAISVYTPDEHFMQAVKALRERSIKALSEPEVPRSPVANVSAPPQSGYEKCLLSGRLGCDDLYSNYYPAYLPGVAVRPVRGVQPAFFPAPRPPASRPDPTRVSRTSPSR